jgi:tRNA dimethylallyltransferase
LRAIDEIQSRGRRPLVVGGSGLYIKALTHGLSFAPAPNRELRAELNELSLDQLRARLVDLDPARADKSDMKNRRRLVRVIEICLLTGCPDSTQPRRWGAAAGDALCGEMPRLKKAATASPGVFLFRDRAELYARINRRVEAMFENGVIDVVRNSRIPGRKDVASAMRRANSASHAPLRQTAVDLVSAPN